MLHGESYTHVQVFERSELIEIAGSKRGVVLTVEGSLPFMVCGEVDLFLGMIEDYDVFVPQGRRT